MLVIGTASIYAASSSQHLPDRTSPDYRTGAICDRQSAPRSQNRGGVKSSARLSRYSAPLLLNLVDPKRALAPIGHWLDSQQRESSMNQLQMPESQPLRCSMIEGPDSCGPRVQHKRE